MIQGTSEDIAVQLQLRLEVQENAVADEVSAITAIVRPILQGVLYALKRDIVVKVGGYEEIPLSVLARLRRPGDGDVGICFEYAVHDALTRKEPAVTARVADALARCKLPGHGVSSILFGAEKQGALSLIDTAANLFTKESVLHYGTRGRPVKLMNHIRNVATAFRRQDHRLLLPHSISGLWKADLFTGRQDEDRWIGTTLKVNRQTLVGARGLRLGIVPAEQGESDKIVMDDTRNLVICPLPYDASFMQVFYQAWEVVVQFFNADAKVPKEVNLPRPASRQVAHYLEDRRDFKVLVETRQQPTTTTTTLLAPMPVAIT